MVDERKKGQWKEGAVVRRAKEERNSRFSVSNWYEDEREEMRERKRREKN